MNGKKRRTPALAYVFGGVIALFLGFSVSWTLQDAVAPDLRSVPVEVVLPEPDSYPMSVKVRVQEDGWTSYTRQIVRDATATWVASIHDLNGALICRGSGRTTYRPETTGTFYWDISYFVNDQCALPLPVGAKATIMYIFDIPESKRPMVYDFWVEPKSNDYHGRDRPEITRWVGYDQGEPKPEVAPQVMKSPYLYTPILPE